MSYSNQTPHYHLPQWVGSDILNPLTDLNKAFEDIDTAIYDVGEAAGSESAKVAALETKVGDAVLDTVAQNLSAAVNELKAEDDEQNVKIAGAEADIDVLEGQMSTATGNITTLATTVSGLEVAVQGKASTADVQAVADDVADVQSDVSDLEAKVGTVTSQTLAAGATSVSFNVPTTGDNVIDFYSSDGSNYTAINTSVSGVVTLTYDAAASDRVISCAVKGE